MLWLHYVVGLDVVSAVLVVYAGIAVVLAGMVIVLERNLG